MKGGAEAVDVDGAVVSFSFDDLRGEIPVSSDLEGSLIGCRTELCSAAEVRELDGRPPSEARDKNVFKFDVAVHDVLTVEGVKPSGNLLDQGLGVLLIERLVRLLADALKQVTCGHLLGHDVVVLVVLEGLQSAQNVLRARFHQLLAELTLLEGDPIVEEGLLDLELADDFDGDLQP